MTMEQIRDFEPVLGHETATSLSSRLRDPVKCKQQLEGHDVTSRVIPDCVPMGKGRHVVSAISAKGRLGIL